MNIIRADLTHLEELAGLFDLYRQFYEQPADLEVSRNYLRDRLSRNESIIFIAFNDDNEAVGFTQLYRSFCSLAMKEIFYLYDLFVSPTDRRQGVATVLMNTARDFARAEGASRLSLDTQVTNLPGQTLYETLGYERDDEFYTYHLPL